MTHDELEVCGDLYALRLSEDGAEHWSGLFDERIPAAHALWERGVIDRKWTPNRSDLIWRLSDQAFTAYELGGATYTAQESVN